MEGGLNTTRNWALNMRIGKGYLYSVAPLTKKEQLRIIEDLREEFPEPSGIPTFYICRKIGAAWPSENNLCYRREDRNKPCSTLCHICVKILHTLLVRDKAYFRNEEKEKIR